MTRRYHPRGYLAISVGPDRRVHPDELNGRWLVVSMPRPVEWPATTVVPAGPRPLSLRFRIRLWPLDFGWLPWLLLAACWVLILLRLGLLALGVRP